MKPLRALLTVLALSFLAFPILPTMAGPGGGAASRGKEETAMLKLESPTFQSGKTVPVHHTCDGKDLSPGLSWSGGPEGVKSWALLCDDPDAPVGTWVHWVLFNLPPDVAALPEGVPADKELKNGARQGKNDFGRIGYGGPCPPPGKAHRYFFRLYALDAPIKLKPGATEGEVQAAMKGHVLAEAELMGTYARAR